jgi:RNase H-like domain found in reverse transcriptase
MASAQMARLYFCQLLHEYQDIFALKLGPQPACKFPPMCVVIPVGVRPVRARPRPMPPAKREFVRQQTSALEKYGMIYSNPTSEWAHPVHIVSKPGAAHFRLTVDLRQGNALQKQSAYPMPHLESSLHNLRGSGAYGTYDMLQCYWQLSYSENSQECQTFIAPDGTWTPRRVLHGNSNAVAHLQSSMDAVLQPLAQRVMAWLDELLANVTNESALLDVHRQFFELCRVNGVVLHAGKCEFFCMQARWCGRLVSKDGVKYEPRHLQGLIEMPMPTTGAQLMQFVCALGWLRTSLPVFTTLVEPLMDILQAVHSAAGGARTKTAVAKIALADVGWTAKSVECFDTCKKALINATSLAHRDESLRLCVYTDASERHWSSVITQVPYTDLGLPHAEQRHQPLAFLSGSFTGAPFR